MTKIVDNKKIKVAEILVDEVTPWSKISILSSYFTIYAFDKLKEQLKDVEEFRFLFLEPTFTKETEERREYYIEKQTREQNISWTEFEIKMRNELTQTKIAKECADWIKKKWSFKSMKQYDATDARMLHVTTPDRSFYLQWTLDFSSPWLWLSPSKKMEMNMYDDNDSSVKWMLTWFDEIWNDPQLVTEVKEQVLENIQTIYKENSPQFIYFVTLYNLFREYLEQVSEDTIIKERTHYKETVVWNKLYKFQKDWVIWCIDKLERHWWCILADSVWLWKTFEALGVIKYYELRNHRVLVLAPKKLRDNWLLFRENDKRNILADDRFAYDILNHTDLSREKWMSWNMNLEMVNWWNYDLIVIDESHNFRNNDPRKDRITRYQRLMKEVIKWGVKTKVLMLSATPINNRMKDLRNQVAFITEENDQHLEEVWIRSISLTLKKAQQVFNEWLDKPETHRNVESLLMAFNVNYFKLLDTLTIARSRKHIEKYYDTKDIGKFPERLKPINVKSDIDIQWEFPSMEEVNKTAKKLNLSIYAPLSYVRLDKQKKYEEMYDIEVQGGKSSFKQTDREKSLVNLMRVNILKRLESSIYSFTLTLSRIHGNIQNTLKVIEQFENWKWSSYDLDAKSYDKQLVDADGELESLVIGTKVRVDLSDMDLVMRKDDLINDLNYFQELIDYANIVTAIRDQKLADLKEQIKKKMTNPINGDNKKIVIFSSFADTASYLYNNLQEWLYSEFGVYSSLITGWGSNKVNHPTMVNDFNGILMNFSPLSKWRAKIYPDMVDEIDVLIATDCISEWQNLQDCDYLINYDIHWNPVRIIQRFGRIDRIWSINTKIQLVNFRPNMDLDEYINLEQRVKWRMTLLDTAATGEDNVIDENQSKEMNDLQYRKKQMEQVMDQVVDVEDLSWWINITDLTMNDFKMELVEFAKHNKKALASAPKGMYSIVSREWSDLDIESWVIFTLRQINSSALQADEPNALHPYYMVYITDSWQVLYHYLQAKQSLDTFKKLSYDKSSALSELVAGFNKSTADGADMSQYSDLLQKAIQNIIWNKEEKAAESIFELWSSALVDDGYLWIEDFELISFLIIT